VGLEEGAACGRSEENGTETASARASPECGLIGDTPRAVSRENVEVAQAGVHLGGVGFGQRSRECRSDEKEYSRPPMLLIEQTRSARLLAPRLGAAYGSKSTQAMLRSHSSAASCGVATALGSLRRQSS